MTDEMKTLKFVEAITLLKAAQSLTSQASEAFSKACDCDLWLEKRGEQISTAAQDLDLLLNQMREVFQSYRSEIQRRRKDWEDAANGMRKPPFAEGADGSF